MICEKCHNDYPSTYYFATPTICKSCFEKLPEEDKQKLSSIAQTYSSQQTIELRANFGKRFLAALVDFLILIVIILAFYKINGFIDSQIEFYKNLKEIGADPQAIKEFQDEYFHTNRFNFVFPAMLYLLYFLSEAFAGISLGKYLLGLKIANLNGEPATSSQLWTRYFVKNSGSIMSIIWGATLLSFFNLLNTILGLAIFFGFFLILGKNRQNLQDIVAKTAVFKVEIIDELEKHKNIEQTNQG